MWQVIFEELRPEGLVIVAVALDTAGIPAVEAKVRPDIGSVPAIMRPLRGWSEDLWGRMAPPSFPCLLDEEHRVAELYGMINVPTAVWIDEDGHVVRPAEPAGVGDEFRAMDPDTFALPAEYEDKQVTRRLQYLDALRDWVRRGTDSPYALSAHQVRERRRLPSDNDVRAAAHVRLARHLYVGGHLDAARSHLEAAVDLCPEKWNYRRQSMVLEPDVVGQLNVSQGYWDAMDALGEKRFYPPLQMPGVID